MGAQQGGEGSLGHEPGYSPYGAAGQRAGELACILRVRLIARGEPLPYCPGETPRWTDDDRLAFGYLLDFDDSLPALARAMGVESVREIPGRELLEDAHPYVNPYLEWLQEARHAAWGLTSDQAYELVKRGGSFPYEEQLLRLHRLDPYTEAEATVHVWTAWRRALEPMSDPRYHRSARKALRTTIEAVLPNGPRSPAVA
jgi:hypothetical protein